MKVLYGYKNAQKVLKDPVLALGIFDGVHLGHKRVIKEMIGAAGGKRDKVIMTFDPHPRTVILSGKKASRIMSLEHRLSIFKRLGVDAVIVIGFTEFISNMRPEDFVKRVLKSTGTRLLCIGKNFCFGKNRKGDSKLLGRIAEEQGIEVKTVIPVKHKGKVVSSTWLRELISDGNILKAESLLGRPVSVLGTVVKGDQRGKEMGVPTANIDPHQEVLPPSGVYAVMTFFDGSLFKGVLNIGFKPTFYGSSLKRRKEPRIEVNILGYEGDLYGREMEIFFIKKLRKEKKFKNARTLKKQIDRDILKTVKILSTDGHFKKIKEHD
ncbi:MAG: bifunctional riboflavin kinase/FAD synthetase [Candidatus Omnitrophota bacterium]